MVCTNIGTVLWAWFWTDQVCFDGLGCFSNEDPFDNACYRLPDSPVTIQVQFLLYTSHNSSSVQPLTPDLSSIQASHYDGSKKTKFIIHGAYQEDDLPPWVHQMRTAILNTEDVNVIVVDWLKGASKNESYFQAAANARIVGALVAQLMTSLRNATSSSYETMHLIGHSLGAHVAGYAGSRVSGLGRISGLDPVLWGFDGTDRRVKLNAQDANYVDVIHTNGKRVLGIGIWDIMGHADFYPNGGRQQPGCPGFFESAIDYITGEPVGCSHLRVLDLYIESITSDCPFTGYPCRNQRKFDRGKCTCNGGTCGRMGYFSDLGNQKGRFELETNSTVGNHAHRYLNNKDGGWSRKAMVSAWSYLLGYVCYTSIGCFYNKSPYNNADLLLPESPSEIKVKFYLYTKKNMYKSQKLSPYSKSKTIRKSNFDGKKKTKFIIHGYRDYGMDPWVKRMKKAILKKEDANVFIVDWKKGANKFVYAQAAANTRVVGALIAHLIKKLKKYKKALYYKTHLIGHSLGAHIAGYAGDRISGLGRISGLDPANLNFESKSKKVRLDAGDAKFVDVIHTNGKPFKKVGFGSFQRMGHVDFYPNGGRHQPGCSFNVLHLYKFFRYGFKELVKTIACSHGRAVNLFTESITSKCRFTAYPCKSESKFRKGKCKCTGSKCGRMGYFADKGKRSGRFELKTRSKSPYCIK